MEILNLGILAHVDAGKTTLTERTLFETGVIRQAGRVDDGNTQTDTLEIERARGITIKSAVVSFQLGDLKVNLIDTPGHSDFIAEVERSLGVLDAVVLVISAVEGVQAQTRRLLDAIHERGIPVLFFVNKIDRAGAREGELLDEIRIRLKSRVIPFNTVHDLGTRDAAVVPFDRCGEQWQSRLIEILTESSEALLTEYVETNGRPSPGNIQREFADQIVRREITPVFFGSAMTGTGVDQLLCGIETLLPPAKTRVDAPLAGIIFKILRNRQGEKLVFARVFSGSLALRQRLPIREQGEDSTDDHEARITGIDLFERGSTVAVSSARAGEIVRLHGIKDARIGDMIGEGAIPRGVGSAIFPPPAL